MGVCTGTLLRHEEDLCLLRLARPITTQPVAPVLPAAMADTALTAGRRLRVSGYGARRLEAGMPVDSGTLYLGEPPFVRRTAKEFLAGAMGETDTCGGDSGGPGVPRGRGDPLPRRRHCARP